VTLADVLPVLHARVDVPLGALLLDEVVEVELESVLLTVVGAAVLTAAVDVLVAMVAGAHAARATMLIVITRLKMFFWFISFLHLFVLSTA
jgi:hypothetical protein